MDSRTQVISARTRCDTQAPGRTNASAACAWRASSPTTRRTSTFVSTARMALPNVSANPGRELVEAAGAAGAFREQRLTHVFERVPARAADHDPVLRLLPLDDGARREPEPPPDLGGNGDLPLGRDA